MIRRFLPGLLVLLAGCAGPAVEVPLPDLGTTEPQVVERIEEAATRVRQEAHSAEAWGGLANVLDAHGFFAEAAACYREALAVEPDVFEWAYHLALVLQTQGAEIGETSRWFDEARRLRPDYAPLYFWLGEAQSQHGDNDTARRNMEKAIELDPNLGAPHRALGQLLMLGGETEPAIHHLERAVALDPQDGSAFAALAQALRLSGDVERAAKAAEFARRLKPRIGLPDAVRYEVHSLNTSAAAAAARGRAAMAAGDFEEAIPFLQQSDEWKPGSATVHHNLGICYLRTGRPDAAREYFESAVAISDDSESHWRLAMMELDVGRAEPALAHLRGALLRAPEDGSLFGRIATAMARAGAQEEALEWFERAAEVGPPSASLENNWGAALLQLGRDEDALARFRSAIALDPGHPEAPLNAGALLERLGREGEAQEFYRQALARDPDHPARQRLEALEGR